MTYFVDKNSIVREIWGKSDTILLVFAGASAEFALNKAVDWLYFTGRLPKDPLGRLFSTVSYARKIVFSDQEHALKAIDTIVSIHQAVEQKRGQAIPNWAYKDVLFMLIDYSIRAFDILERPLTNSEKEEVYQVFFRVGQRMGIQHLPSNYEDFKTMRHVHLTQNLQYSTFTKDLYKQYKKHLGPIRYVLLLESQKLICPKLVKTTLNQSKASLLAPFIWPYKLSRSIQLDAFLKTLLLPSNYKKEIESLNHMNV